MLFNALVEEIVNLRQRCERAIDASPVLRLVLLSAIFATLVTLAMFHPQFKKVAPFPGRLLFFGGVFLIPVIVAIHFMNLPRWLAYPGGFLGILLAIATFHRFSVFDGVVGLLIYVSTLYAGFYFYRFTRSLPLSAIVIAHAGFFLGRAVGGLFSVGVPPAGRHERIILMVSPAAVTFDWKRLLHPIHFLYPLPSVEPQKPPVAVTPGAYLLSIQLGLMFFLAALWVGTVSKGFDHLKFHSWWAVFALGWMKYLFFYLTSTALAGVSVSLLGLMDLTRMRGTDFSFLATNPMERWRRWNMPFYNWFMVMIYLPAFRRFKSHLVAVVLVFLMSFYMHAAREISFGALSLEVRRIVSIYFFFFMAHALVLYISILRPRWFPNNFLGFAFTQILMAAVHSLWVIAY